jgi:rare lipoprotein A
MLRRHYFLFITLLALTFANAQEQIGLASVRPLAHEGMKTESNVYFSHDSLVASHRSIPLGKIVRVTNLNNLNSVELKINDRGPYVKNRIIDLSQRAAFNLGISQGGVANVKIEILPDDAVILKEKYPIDTRLLIRKKTSEIDTLTQNRTLENQNNAATEMAAPLKEVNVKPKENKKSVQEEEEQKTEVIKAVSAFKESDETPDSEQIKTDKETVKVTAKLTSVTFTEDNPVLKPAPQHTEEAKTDVTAEYTELKETPAASENKQNSEKKKELDTKVKETLENLDIQTNQQKESSGIKTTDTKESSETQYEKTSELEKHKGNFSLQVASFSDKKEATDYATELLSDKKIYNVKVVQDKENGTPVFKIYVGKYTALKYAQAYKEQLSAKGIDAFVVAID